MPDTAGTNVWLRTSDGEPLEQQFFSQNTRRWINQVEDLDEPDYVTISTASNPWRARKPDLPWIPSDNGITISSSTFTDGVLRFFEVGDGSIPEPVPSKTHDYTITTGAQDGIIGWWDNNIGSIDTGNTFDLPDGTNVRIRQSMLVASRFRFLVNGSNRAEDQFPDRVKITDDDAMSVWENPESRNQYGQGTGRDYNLTNGANPFTAANKSLSIRLEWD